MKTSAVRIHAPGGPEVLAYEEVDVAPPGANEVQIRQEAIGVNFIDVNHRTGAYPVPLPAILGCEAAGTVTAIGGNVSELRPGDRVAYVSDGRGAGPDARGAYAEVRNFAAARVVNLPETISTRTAASTLLKGLTVEALLRRVVRVERGDTILVHAAAGGLGSLLTPWAKEIGACVIGVVSTDAKAEVARTHGCDHVVVSAREDFATKVQELTNGRGVRVVYDSIGRDTFDRSLSSLTSRGALVLFGQASGPVPPFEPARLGRASLFLTRPLLFDYIGTRAELTTAANALFDRLRSGVLAQAAPRTFALRDAASAHRALQQRETTGSLVLLSGTT